MLGQKLKKFNYFFYFQKFLISFSLLGFLSPLEATTYDLTCSPERSYLISYQEKVSSEELITKNRSKYKEDTKSAKKFKVSFNLENNSAFIEGNPAKAIRISDPQPYEYAPLFLYTFGSDLTEDNTSTSNINGDMLSLKTKSTLTKNIRSIRLDRPTDSSGPFYATKSFKESVMNSTLDSMDEESVDTLVEDTVLEILEGYCKK